MKYTICFLTLFVISLGYLQSCSYDKGEIPQPKKSAPYQVVIKPIIQTYCYGQGGQNCHVAVSNVGAPGDFTTYAGLKEKVDNGSIQARVINLKDMPPPYSNGPTALSADDLESFKTWVNNGAQDN